MGFAIGFDSQGLKENRSRRPANDAIGRILLGSHEERFQSNTTFWTKRDYEIHWHQALRRLVNGAERSTLITSMEDPETGNFILWWPIYRVEADLVVQNQMLFLEAIKGRFDAESPYKHIKKRRREDQGLTVSEWVVHLDDVKQFLAQPSYAV